MIEIKEIVEPDTKSYICNEILRSLPDWFGIDASIVDYVEKVRSMPFFAANDDDKFIGFVALKVHNPFTAEVCVMGILQEYHRQGIGKRLIDSCEKYCIDNNLEYLTVKTLDESRECDSYKKTRLFYQSMGFRPLEVFPLHWDEDNPCLFLAKYIPMKFSSRYNDITRNKCPLLLNGVKVGSHLISYLKGWINHE